MIKETLATYAVSTPRVFEGDRQQTVGGSEIGHAPVRFIG